MGKIQDERRKFLVGMNISKINVKELILGISIKIVLNDSVKVFIVQVKFIYVFVELEKILVVGVSLKFDNKVLENVVILGISLNFIIILFIQGVRSKVLIFSNFKKMLKINVDKGENKRYKRYQWNIIILKKFDLYCILYLVFSCIYKLVLFKLQFLGLL